MAILLIKCIVLSFLIQVMVNGSQSATNTTQIPGEYIDIFNGDCCIPLSRTKRSEFDSDIFRTEYHFSISNNGKRFGNTVTVYLFDSICQELIVSENGTFFVLKENTCFISGLCRVQNETRFGDECSVCYSQHNKFDWIDICDTSNVNTGDGQPLEFVLGLFGGLIVALCLIIVFCIWKHFHVKKMLTVADMVIYRTEPPQVMEHRYRRPDLSIFYKNNTE